MAKNSTLKAVIIIVVVSLITYAVWDGSEQVQTAKKRLLPSYQTNTVRTANVGKYCPANVDRTTLVSAGDLSSATSNRKDISSQLGIDGNSLINKLARGKIGDATSMITSNTKNIGMFIGAFLLPFVIFLFMWPFLCCCCCCPSCCPSKCCQKADNQLYSKCELEWPAVTLTLALLLVISTSIYGFVNASNVGPAFNNMGCSLAIFTDDLINGNVTLDGTSFFTGLTLFSNTNLTNIKNNLTELADTTPGGTTQGYVDNIIAVEATVKNIPDGVGSANMPLTYNTPINSNTATANNLISSFSGILGKWSTSSTLMYKLYNSISQARIYMEGTKTSANIFSTQTGTISSQISTIRTTIDNLESDVKSMDKSFGNFLSVLSAPGTYGNMGMQGFYGFMIAFSFFALIGVLLTVCCDKPGCRHMMYCSCIFLFIGAFLAFMVAILFSFLVPFFTWTCDYLNVALSSKVGFEDNFGAFLSTTTTNQISVCMPFGDGKIVSTVAGSAADGLNNLTNVIDSMKNFNNVTLRSYISGNLTELTTSANKYANGDISDLDYTNNEILRGLSNPSNTTNSANCNSATFSADSWVPSNSQDSSYSTAIYCQVSTGTGNTGTCSSTLTGASCKGCMSTTQLISEYANAATLKTDLDARYGSATCAFNGFLSNAWTNYFTKKYTTLGKPTSRTQPGGSVLGRLGAVTPTIIGAGATSVFSSIDAFKLQLNYISGNMSSISSLTDPTYGMLAGLNCKLFGEDFVTFQNVICGSFYNNMFMIRLTFGIAAWGILFSMCCIVCTGVRHFKQIDKLKKIGDNPVREDEAEETRKIAKDKY